MPIEYSIDHERRLVTAIGQGILTDQDVFGYQKEVWSRPELAGYDELIDMSAVDKIVSPSPQRVLQLARLSAAMDPDTVCTKLAIVAPETLAFGLGRMYQAYRESEPRSTKQVRVFHTLDEALAYIATTSA